MRVIDGQASQEMMYLPVSTTCRHCSRAHVFEDAQAGSLVRCQCGADIIVPDIIAKTPPVETPPQAQIPEPAADGPGIARTVDADEGRPLSYTGFEIWAVDLWSYFRIMALMGLVVSVPYAILRLLLAGDRPEGFWALVLFALIYIGGALLQPLYSAWVYNLTSAWLGGVRVKFRRPVWVTSACCVVRRIRPLSALKVGTLGGLVGGAMYVGFFMIIGVLLFGPAINPFAAGARELGPLVVVMIVVPIIASLAGALAGLFLSALYNVGARLWGGVEIHIV